MPGLFGRDWGPGSGFWDGPFRVDGALGADGTFGATLGIRIRLSSMGPSIKPSTRRALGIVPPWIAFGNEWAER